MRTKIVKVADKDILIQEKTIGEIKKIVNIRIAITTLIYERTNVS